MERGDGLSQESIKVTLGVPFRIPESFTIDQSIGQGEYGDIVDVGLLRLEIDGVGDCRLIVTRNVDDEDWSLLIRTPLGSISTAKIRMNDEVETDKDTLPLSVFFSLDGLSAVQLNGLTLTMKTDSFTYTGETNRYFIDESKEDGKFHVTISSWLDENGESVEVWFPQDPVAQSLKEGLQFTLTLE